MSALWKAILDFLSMSPKPSLGFELKLLIEIFFGFAFLLNLLGLDLRLSSIPLIQCHWVIDIVYGSQTNEFANNSMLLVEYWVSSTALERICHVTWKPTLREEREWFFARSNCSPTKSPTIFSIIDTTWLGSVKRGWNRIKFDQRSIWMWLGIIQGTWEVFWWSYSTTNPFFLINSPPKLRSC